MLNVLMILLAGVSVAGNPEVDFRDESAVRKHFAPKKSAVSNWAQSMSTRGTTTTTYTETSKTTWENQYTGWRETESFWVKTTVSKSGTVIALPVGDWREREKFTYYGPYYKVITGRVVTVKVKICAPNETKLPNERQCRNVVKNLAESGMSIPRSAGRSGRLQPLVRLVKNRFGATNVMTIYDGCEDNELVFVLFNCQEEKANPHVRTMMFIGEVPEPDGRNPVEEGHDEKPRPRVIVNRLSEPTINDRQ